MPAKGRAIAALEDVRRKSRRVRCGWRMEIEPLDSLYQKKYGAHTIAVCTPRAGGLKAKAGLKLNGARTESARCHSEVRVRKTDRAVRVQRTQIGIDCAGIEIHLVEDVVEVRTEFEACGFPENRHLR